MDLNNIKIFVLTYELGSFASVAKLMNLAPSSVSRAVANLEQQLNARLFQRSTRKLTPTAEGETYFQKVSPLLLEMDEVHQHLQEQNAGPSGNLKVTASISFGQIVLAPLMKRFCDQYPNITIDLNLSDARVDLISSQSDIAIRHGKLEDSALVARRLSKVSYSLVASQSYIKKAAPICHPSDVNEHPIATFSYEAFRHQWRFLKESFNEIVPIEPKLTVSNAIGIRDCIKNDFGIALLPDWAIEGELKSGCLTQILADWKVTGLEPDPGIWLVQPSRKFIPTKVRAFTDFLLEHNGNF